MQTSSARTTARTVVGRPLRVLYVDVDQDQDWWIPIELQRRGVEVTRLTEADHVSPALAEAIDRVECFGAMENLPSALRALCARESFDWLIPSNDAVIDVLMDTLHELPAVHERLMPRIAPWHEPLLASTAAQVAFAAEHGVAVPESEPLESLAQAEALLAAWGGCVIRGPRGNGGSHVALCRTPEKVREAVDRFTHQGIAPLRVMRLLDGPKYIATGVYRDGEAVAAWQAKAVEVWPAPTGPSTRTVTVQDPALTQAMQTLMAALRWTGFASVDFLKHADGSYRFLELNPRAPGCLPAVFSSDVDVIGALVAVMRGEAIPPQGLASAGRDTVLWPRWVNAGFGQSTARGLARLVSPRALRAAWRQPAATRHEGWRWIWHQARWSYLPQALPTVARWYHAGRSVRPAPLPHTDV